MQRYIPFTCGRFLFAEARPLVMGILNVTPDSFSDGGQFAQRDAALRHAEAMQAAGADILDIGGESSRPGAQPLSLQAELDRVMPILEGVKDCGIAISVDTYKPEVMRAALAAGADMINDIWALQQPGALDVVAQSTCGICLMHMQKDPQSMQQAPAYQNVVEEVVGFWGERVQALDGVGITPDRICLDPGFGFGKTVAHNLELLNALPAFSALPFPLLAGLSRKSVLGAITGKEPAQRMAASVAAHLLAAQNGARILRVHDVAETVDALKVWQALEAQKPRLKQA